MSLVAVGIISRAGDDNRPRYLLVKSNRDFGEFTGCWYPPGGHVEAGEGERDALIREIREELGLTVAPIAKIAETPGDVPDQVTCWWQADAVGEISLDDSELAEAGWFTQKQMVAMRLWPATKKFFEHYIFALLSEHQLPISLVVLRRYPSLMEAEVARLRLSQAGIKSVLQADALPGAGTLIQGAELLVADTDVARAREALS